MSQRQPTILSVSDVIKRSSAVAETKTAADASQGLSDSHIGSILDDVTGAGMNTKVASQANTTATNDSLAQELGAKVAETAALSSAVGVKEAQLLGAAFMDGMAIRAQQYESSGVKVASEFGTGQADAESAQFARALGYKQAAALIFNAVANEIMAGEKVAEEFVWQTKEAVYNAGHVQTLQLVSNLNI